jgi:hypothetical protein
MSGDEYDGDANIGLRQLRLKIETADSRQPHIEYEPAWHVRALALQELLRRGKCLGSQLYGLKESGKCLAHRRVVVHDKDDRPTCARNELG